MQHLKMYSAMSLEEIADWFDAKSMDAARNKKSRCMSEMETWHAAAEYLRHCQIGTAIDVTPHQGVRR